ncbi:hypothetical protein D3C81_1259300 [compost metagenome]
MARHPAGDRVNRVLHGDAAMGQFLGQFLQRVLCPCNRQAVARNDDHGVGVGQQEGRVVSRTGLHRTCFFRTCRAGISRVAETTEQNVEERTVHRLAHDVRQNRTGRTHQGAGNDQHRVVQREADTCRSPARVAVEHRHHDRHVGATNRDDDQHAHDERQGQHQRERRQAAGQHEGHAEGQRREAQQQVELVLAAELYRCALEQAELVLARQLAEGNDRTGEGDRTNGRAEEQLQAVARWNRVAQLLDDA